MLQICRTCLEETSDSDFISLNDDSTKIKDELRVCIPELDLNLIPDATICVYCANSLHAAYDFKQKCLQTEEKIKSHKKSNEGLDLVQIKQEPEFDDEKFDVVHGVGIGMEVIFIKDDAENEENLLNGHVEDEAVNSFLDLNPKIIEDTSEKPLKSNGTTHSVTKKHSKKKPKSTLHEPHNTNTRSKRLVNGQKTFKCDLCTYTTIRENLFKLHMKTHSINKSYHCRKCSYETAYQHCLQKHIKNCAAKKLFKCTQCAFKTLHKDTFEKHMQVHSKIFKCTKCSFKVSSLSTFKRHVTIHENEKSHKCTQCDYTCFKALTLKKHVEINHKERPYKCNMCSYSSYYSSTLANHLLTHTGEGCFACTLCDYKAIQKANLKKHMKNHKSKGQFKCTKCSFATSFNYNLQSHMAKCHKEEKKK